MDRGKRWPPLRIPLAVPHLAKARHYRDKLFRRWRPLQFWKARPPLLLPFRLGRQRLLQLRTASYTPPQQPRQLPQLDPSAIDCHRLGVGPNLVSAGSVPQWPPPVSASPASLTPLMSMRHPVSFAGAERLPLPQCQGKVPVRPTDDSRLFLFSLSPGPPGPGSVSWQ